MAERAMKASKMAIRAATRLPTSMTEPEALRGAEDVAPSFTSEDRAEWGP
jgi:hypothetical protein